MSSPGFSVFFPCRPRRCCLRRRRLPLSRRAQACSDPTAAPRTRRRRRARPRYGPCPRAFSALATIASSETSTTSATWSRAIGNVSSPTRFGARESAAIPPAGASTGFPAASARVSVGASSGSTPTILTSPPYHAATPPMRPPPPTATRRVSISPSLLAAARERESPAREAFPSGRRRGCASAPDSDAQASLAARASAYRSPPTTSSAP